MALAHSRAWPPARAADRQAGRPSNRSDHLGLRRALSDRLLPLLVCAMVFLAALAMAGAMAASALAVHWNTGAAAMVTVTVPAAANGQDGAALSAVARVLAASPAIASVRPLPAAEIAALLKPWLGVDPGQLSLRLPALFELRLNPGVADPGLSARLQAASPGAVLERNGDFVARLTALVRSLQACAALAVVVVAFVAAAVVAVATRAGLAALRDAIGIVHSLGAPDGLIAGQFAHRVTVLVLAGALLGVGLVLPVLLGMARLAAPFQSAAPPHPLAAQLANPALVPALIGMLPPALWAVLAALPVISGLIGWATAQIAVRSWLRVLP